MALTTASRFDRITINYHLGTNVVETVVAETTDGDWIEIYFEDGGADPLMGDPAAAHLATLRAINATAAGFQNADGDPPTVEVTPWGLGWDSVTDIVSPWQNPFIGQPDASQYPGGGVSPIGTRFNRAILYQMSATEPANPPADWWNVTGNGYIANLGSWSRTRETAAAVSGATGSMWFAIDTVRVSSNGTKVYEGWNKHAEFGVQFRADGNAEWRDAYMDGDERMGFRTADGTFQEVVINRPKDPNWVLIEQGDPYNTGGGGWLPFANTVNLNLYDSIRFDWQPFGLYVNNARSNLSAVRSTRLWKPADGWRSVRVRKPTDTDEVASFQWHIEDANVGNMQFLEGGIFGLTTLEPAVTRGLDSSGHQLPFISGSGKAAFVGSDADNPHLVQGLDLYKFVDGMYYQRFNLKLYGEVE